MQRYRVNYRLLIALAVSGFVAAPAAYGLWKFQVGRNASRLIGQAEEAEKEGDYESAYESLSQYVRLRRSDTDALVRLGQAIVELSKKPDLEFNVRSESYFALIEAVHTTSTLAKDPAVELSDEMRADIFKLRRELVNMHMMYRLWDRALQSIEELLVDGKGDNELRGMKAQALFETKRPETLDWAYKMVGYDKKADEFDVAKAEAADQPKVYLLLAKQLIENRQKELAERVANQLAVANPESREAYVYQFQILSALDRTEEARAAIEKAYAIDPKDAAVLQAKGSVAIDDYQKALEAADKPENAADAAELRKDAEKYLDQASAFFTEGLEAYPEAIGFYEQVARIESFRQRIDGAMKIIEQGLKKFDLQKHLHPASGMPTAMDLESQKIDMLFSKGDVDAVRKEIKALREIPNQRVHAIADYYEARIEVYNQNWLEAARRLNEVKFRLDGNPGLQALASTTQAGCHYRLGQYDLARAAYLWAYEKNSKLTQAKLGYDEMNRLLGQIEVADTPLQFDDVIKKELAKPVAEQNWTKVEDQIGEYVAKEAEIRGATKIWTDARTELMRAQTYVMRAMNTDDEKLKTQLFVQARDAVTRAYNLDKTDIDVQLAAPRVLMMQPGSGPAKALDLLEKIIALNKARGKEETLPFRLLRIDLLTALHDEQLANQLHAATEGISDWSKDDQARVWSTVAARFEQIGQLQDAELCLLEAVKLSPTSLPYRISLFELARKQANDEGMRAAQKGILELLKDETTPDYVLTEVKRQMVGLATGALTKDDLKQARRQLEDAIKIRPTWGELHVLSGQLYMVLENDPAKALASFDKALATGPANLGAVNLQVRLLAELGRFPDARKMMDRIPQTSWSQVLERSAAIVLLNVGEQDKAYAEAKKLADANPTDAAVQVWFAEMATQCDKAYNDARQAAAAAPTDAKKQKALADAAKKSVELAAAETAFKKALELTPTVPDYWSALLNYYMTLKKAPEVESTLRQAQLALDEEFLTLLTAQQHRLFGRFPQAESIFLSAYGDKLDEPGVAQRLAEFYLGWGEQDPVYRGKAARHLNAMLRAANEGKLQPNDPLAIWARRQAARLFSLNGDYQDSLKAEQLLTATVVASNQANEESTELLVDILNRRGDPASRNRMIALLQKIQAGRPLQPKYELMLAQALSDAGNLVESERQIQAAIARSPSDLALRVGQVEMLIARKDLVGAERALASMARLTGVEGSAAAIPQLRVRLVAASGDKAKLRQTLESITPNLGASLNETQLKIVRSVALLADSVGDHEYALKLITEYVRRIQPTTPENEYLLAQFIAMYGDVNDGLERLMRLFPSHMDQVLGTSIDVLRLRRKEDPAKLSAMIDRMVSRARIDDPDSARRMIQEAESLEIQERYPEAIAAYTKLLARDDAPKQVRATAGNNRSFLLAITKQDLDLALEGVNEAMDIIGPISDILDTRGLVYIYRGEFDKAVVDLKLAVTMNATANKYFHLSQALLGAGDQQGALEAWKNALAWGIGVDKVPTVEQPELQQTMKKLEALGASVPKT